MEIMLGKLIRNLFFKRIDNRIGKNESGNG